MSSNVMDAGGGAGDGRDAHGQGGHGQGGRGHGHDAGGHGGHGHAGSAHEEHGGHASVGFYWLIGGILTVITALEVAVFYIEALEAMLVPILLVLSAAKFVLVVMFFMHLKWDSRIFTGVFLAGLFLATFMILAMITIYHFLPRFEA